MIPLIWDPQKGIWCEDQENVDKLRKNYFGTYRNKKLFLEIEEVLYLINFQNAVCMKGKKVLQFNDIAAHYAKKDPRFFIKYNAYRDWRDRGLIAKSNISINKKTGTKSKRYPMKPIQRIGVKSKVFWYPESMVSIIDDKEISQSLFSDYWLGQLGIYKQERGSLLKLDFMETVFLSKFFGADIYDVDKGKNTSAAQILKEAVIKREYAKQLYDVYEDWRLRGYVIKTGFKFGTHFRIYFPGASPTKENKWIHSKHVLHVFPKEQKLLISEWARAVRVAHGVKKTFLLSVPELKKKDFKDYPAEFFAYRRKKEKIGWVRETPDDHPRYLLVPVSEDDHIGGAELASLLKKAKDIGVEVLLSITDRETAITYYVLKKINLPGSKFEYYEIEWMKP